MPLHLITSTPKDYQGFTHDRSHCGQFTDTIGGVGGTTSIDHPVWNYEYGYCKVCYKEVLRRREARENDYR